MESRKAGTSYWKYLLQIWFQERKLAKLGIYWLVDQTTQLTKWCIGQSTAYYWGWPIESLPIDSWQNDGVSYRIRWHTKAHILLGVASSPPFENRQTLLQWTRVDKLCSKLAHNSPLQLPPAPYSTIQHPTVPTPSLQCSLKPISKGASLLSRILVTRTIQIHRKTDSPKGKSMKKLDRLLINFFFLKHSQ